MLLPTIRVCAPYKDKPMTPEVAHTIEHIGATYMREHYKKYNLLWSYGLLNRFLFSNCGNFE